MNFPIQFFIIQLILNWARGEAIQGDNVRDASQNEFPFVVALSGVSNEIERPALVLRQFCTGSLITKKHVLTAEHCLLNKQVHEVEVLVGSTNLDQCKAYDPEKWTTYQEWKYNNSEEIPPFYYDVAVITLKKCVSERNTPPVIVSKLKLQDLFGTNAKIAGWGLTNGNVKPFNLRTADLKVLSNTDCESKLSQIVQRQVDSTITDMLLICATSEPWALNACGDSGGPLLNERNEIIGITLGTCPKESVILNQYPSTLFIILNRLMEKRVNLHANLNYYKEFLAHFKYQNRHCNL